MNEELDGWLMEAHMDETSTDERNYIPPLPNDPKCAVGKICPSLLLILTNIKRACDIASRRGCMVSTHWIHSGVPIPTVE